LVLTFFDILKQGQCMLLPKISKTDPLLKNQLHLENND